MLLNKRIPLHYVFGKVTKELFFVSAYTVAVTVLYHTVPVAQLSIPIAVPAIVGTVLSLLLGFRSNQAYDRWWEARHIWGAIVNDSRTLARQVLWFKTPETDKDILSHFRERFVKRQVAWCYATGRHLRREDTLTGDVERLLNKKDLEYISRYKTVPAALLELHAKDLSIALEEHWINPYQQVEIDRTISRLCDAMGKCERIKNTVFPSTYTLYIRFALFLFITMLPFSLMEIFGYFGVPLIIAISACFLLIEKMGIHLQDPFENKPTDTPMTTISKNIERDLMQMLRLQEEPEQQHAPVADTSYYIL
jgi:ion channel-forming bestrophin family protein